MSESSGSEYQHLKCESSAEPPSFWRWFGRVFLYYFTYNTLPQVVLDVGVELQGLIPAEVAGGAAYVLLVVGQGGAVAAVVFVVALAVEVGDEVMLQCAFYTGRHVVIHVREAEGHADGLVVAVQWAGLCLCLWVVEVDAARKSALVREVVAEDAAETVLTERTCLCVADTVVRVCFQREDLFARHRWVISFFHLLMVL